MRAPLLLPVIVMAAGCAGVSPDPAAMEGDIPAGREIGTVEREALAARTATALARLEAGDGHAAREIAEAVLEVDPRDGRARAVLAHALMREALTESPPTLSTWRRAEGELRRASRTSPADPVVARLHATFLIADGHLSAAAERVESGLEHAADDRELLELGARVRFDLGDERAALVLLERLLAVVPDDRDAVWRLAQCEARLAPAETDPGVRHQRLAAAAAAFRRYRDLAPEDPDGPLGEAQVRIAGLAGTPDEDEVARLLELYGTAARLAPGSPAPAFGQGAVLELAGRTEEAQSAYRAALALDARHVPSILNLAASLAAGGDRAAARVLLTRALELGVSDDERRRIEDWLAADR